MSGPLDLRLFKGRHRVAIDIRKCRHEDQAPMPPSIRVTTRYWVTIIRERLKRNRNPPPCPSKRIFRRVINRGYRSGKFKISAVERHPRKGLLRDRHGSILSLSCGTNRSILATIYPPNRAPTGSYDEPYRPIGFRIGIWQRPIPWPTISPERRSPCLFLERP